MGKTVMFEVRRDVDTGERMLRRGAKVSEGEAERLAAGKLGLWRRTGLIRPVGSSDRDEIAWRKAQRHGRLTVSNHRQVEQLRAGGSDE